MKSAMSHNIYHEYFDGEGEVWLKVVGTEDKFEIQREKIEDGSQAILRAAVTDEEKFIVPSDEKKAKVSTDKDKKRIEQKE